MSGDSKKNSDNIIKSRKIGNVHIGDGLDEEAVNAMLSSVEKNIVEKLKQLGIDITKDVTDNICTIVESTFVSKIYGPLQEGQKSIEEIRKEVKNNFDELKNNVENFCEGIFVEFNKQREELGDVKKALSAMAVQQSKSATEVLSRLDELNQKLDTIFDRINVMLSSQEADRANAYRLALSTSYMPSEASYSDLLEAGWYYLCSGEFDLARAQFQSAINNSNAPHEAYFGFALAFHHIQLLDTGDSKSDDFNKIPIYCKEGQDLYLDKFGFEQDPNYKNALKYSEGIPQVRDKYVKCAQNIADIVKLFNSYGDEKLEYDCFICCKISKLDENGHSIEGTQTEDCEWAIKLHEQLSKLGLHPFFSKCDIQCNSDNLGTKYEALILYALIHSKCMVLVCSDKKYFANSIYMQNEYNRFMEFSREDGNKPKDNILLVRKNTPVNLPRQETKQHLIRQDDDEESIPKVCKYVSLKVTRKMLVSASPTLQREAKDSKGIDDFNKGRKCYNKKDYATAVELFSSSAESGNIDALYYMGICYENGQGVAKDIDKALNWYNRAANQGHSKARTVAKRITKEQEKQVETKRRSEKDAKNREAAENANRQAMLDAIKQAKKNVNDFQIEDEKLIKYLGTDAEVIIPNNVRIICKEAFKDCTNVSSITISACVTAIEDDRFQDCISLKNIAVDEDNTNYSSCNGVLYNKDKTRLIYVPEAFEGVFVFPKSVTEVSSHAFFYCRLLTKVVLQDKVKGLSPASFILCDKLQYNKYDNAEYLGTANNPYFMLVDNSRIDVTSCNINADTKYIGVGAFQSCKSLIKVTIPVGVIEIGACAFYRCSSLSEVTIFAGIKSIQKQAFSDCPNLKIVFFQGGSRQQWKKILKQNCGLDYRLVCYGTSRFQIDGTVLVKYLGEESIVTIPEGITRIANYAFKDCKRTVSKVILPSTLIEIENKAFGFRVDLDVEKVNGKINVIYKDFYGGNKK